MQPRRSPDEAQTQIRLALADGAISPLSWNPEPASPPSSGRFRFPGNPPPQRDDHWRLVDLDWERSRVFDTFARAKHKALLKLYREADQGPTKPPTPRKSSWRALLLDRAACESLWPQPERRPIRAAPHIEEPLAPPKPVSERLIHEAMGAQSPNASPGALISLWVGDTVPRLPAALCGSGGEMTEHPIGLVPLSIVHNDDRRGELMELIEAKWQSGRLGLWGRRKDTSFPIKKINQYKGLELLWMAGPEREDYYCDVGAHPSVIGKTGYYRHLWEEIHIREEDLVRLRNEILSSGRVGLATHKQHACGSAMPSDVRQDLEEARSFHDQPMPDTAGLQRLSEALAQLREKARSAIRSREARQMPADVMEERSRQAGEDVNRELLVGFARGRISAFLDTHFGVERLPYGPYWLLPDGGATLEAKRALLGTASSNRHHGLAGIVKVHVANFQDFANTYLTERGLAKTEISDAIAPAVDFFVRLGWLPLDRAVEIIKKVEEDTAWHQVKTAIRLKELPARSFVEAVTRDLEPHWLDFLVWDVPPETSSVLWFDREKAWRKAGRPVDRAGIPLPDRAEKIMVSIRRCAEIWPAAVWPEVPGVAMAAPEAVAPNEDDIGPISTGMPGRPSKGKHLIEDEFDRRCGVGEVLSTIAEEAKALLSWYREAYRKEPPPTQKTTENNIRAAHRRWLASVRINGHDDR